MIRSRPPLPLAPALVGALLAALASPSPARAASDPAPTRIAAPDPRSDAEEEAFRQAAARLVGEALLSRNAYENLVHLCDRIGSRLAGSAALDRAILWAMERMRAEGLEGVRAEEVRVPVWVRGEERAALVHPVERPLPILGLGGTVGTPEGGIVADVVVVRDFEHLRTLGRAVAGRIVLYDVPFTTYGETVAYRVRGATEAARLGAVAALVRSVTPESLATPHTGALAYAEDVPPIPAAAVTVEDALAMRRLAERGFTPRVRLQLGARTLPDAPSANVVGEVRGRERPEEIVVVACHLDSWDVGQGAQDDGAGCVMAMEAARLIARLERRPRRTVRVVLFTNEENGLRGARAYVERHRDELERHVAALEADTGAGAPLGFRVEIPEAPTEAEREALGRRALEGLAPVQDALAPLGAGALRLDRSGADVGALVRAGVPALGLDQDMSGYWPIHHTAADTVDKVDPNLLARNVAAMAVMAYWLADTPEPLPRPAPEGGAP